MFKKRGARITFLVSVAIVGAWLGGCENSIFPLSTPNTPVVYDFAATSLSIAWSGISGASEYVLYRDEYPACTSAVIVYRGSSTNYHDEELIPEITYYYKVQAKSRFSSSDLSPAAQGTTIGTVPETPAGLTVSSAQINSLDVAWQPTINAIGYIVYRDTDRMGSFNYEVYNGSANSFLDNSLSGGTTYYYRIKAGNNFGYSDLSQAVGLATLWPTPPVPSGMRVGDATTNSLKISWDDAITTTVYHLYRDTDQAGLFLTLIYEGDAVGFTDTGLSSGTTYYYKARASNPAGFSAFSSVVNSSTLGTVLPAPTGLVVGEATQTTLMITWDVVSGATRFRLSRNTDQSGNVTFVVYEGENRSFIDTGLLPGTMYFYIVAASDATGFGSASLPVGARTLYTPPAAPTGLAISEATADSLRISWQTVTDATVYRIYRNSYLNNTTDTLVYDGNNTSFVDTSLNPESVYYYKACALGPGGTSEFSNVVVGSTLGYPPDIPMGLAVDNATFTSATISWQAQSSATGYEVFRDSSSAGLFNLRVYDGTIVSFKDTNLTSGVTYYYKVRARNNFGAGTLSEPVPATIPISSIMLLPGTGSFTYSADFSAYPGMPYFVFTNHLPSVSAGRPRISDQTPKLSKALTPVAGVKSGGKGSRDLYSISDYLANPFNFIDVVRSRDAITVVPQKDYDSIGVPLTFKHDSVSNTIPATCRKIVANAGIAGAGTRTLNVWVANDCWVQGGTKTNLVTQAMVNLIADKFLNPVGTDDDIYDWVTNILGPEYGTTGIHSLIPVSDSITILIYDIDEDNSVSGGTIGYFWAKDQFKLSNIAYSNERVMFYLDAVMLATPDIPGNWAENDRWPTELVSTMAHEFQHLVHYYQKTILRTDQASTDRWINEMSSMMMEDLVAEKLGIPNPSGVPVAEAGRAGNFGNSNGLLSLYNQYVYLSPTNWLSGDDVYKSYSIAYAFGAYLVRNFGGARLLRDIVLNEKTDYTAIETALALAGYKEDFPDLIRKWGAAVIMSGNTDTPAGYRYNSGGYFLSELNGTTYRTGSINLYNYSPEPAFFASSPVGYSNQAGYSNTFFRAGTVLGTVHTWNIELMNGISITIVIK